MLKRFLKLSLFLLFICGIVAAIMRYVQMEEKKYVEIYSDDNENGDIYYS